jgi:DNA-binding CsgD family transcriptional regulator
MHNGSLNTYFRRFKIFMQLWHGGFLACEERDQVVGQTVESPVAIEGLLRQLIHQIEDGLLPSYKFGDEALETAVVLDIRMDGVRYTLTRCFQTEQPPITLSPREREVVRLVAKGLSNKTIAAVLDISPWTVSTHMRRIFTKLEVGSRAEMVTFALQAGLLNSLS